MPGPWNVEPDDLKDNRSLMVYCNDATGARIADCTNDAVDHPREQKRANAILIAAAPDLLEAAKILIATSPAFRSKPVGQEGSQARLRQVDQVAAEDAMIAAIAKAEGR